MEIEVRNAMTSYVEAVFRHDNTRVSTGLMDQKESYELGLELISAAIDLLRHSGSLIDDSDVDVLISLYDSYA